MAFGNASLPARKYAYGAREYLPGPRAVVNGVKQPRARFGGHEPAVDQLRLATQYQNKLVEIERARRAAAVEHLHATFPDLLQQFTEATALDARIEEMRTELKRRNAAAHSTDSDPIYAAEIRALYPARSGAWKSYTALRNPYYRHKTAAPGLAAVEAAAKAANLAAKEHFVGLGLYWGTESVIARAVKHTGPPPQFKPFTGEGILAVQFQRKPDRTSERVAVMAPGPDGTPVPRLHPRTGQPMMRFEGGSSLRGRDIHHANTLCWLERTGHRHHVVCHFRVGSTETGKPVWADVPVHYHRPVPPDAEIKWAYLHRVRVGTKFVWKLLLDVAWAEEKWTLHDSEVKQPRAETGTVAVALGWRKLGDTIRVATWVGDDGETGEVTVPAEKFHYANVCTDLQSIMDTNFEADRNALVAFLHGRELSEEWQRRTAALHQWKSRMRLMALVTWWRTNRLPGDDDIFRRMEGELVPGMNGARSHYTGGRKQMKHLHDWSEFQRRGYTNWRKHFFRATAIELAARYSTVAVADIDWQEIAENESPESGEDDVNKTFRWLAACASFRDELQSRMRPVVVRANGVTVECCHCGARLDPPGAGQWVVCESCGDGFRDRAMNAANNILGRALGAMADAEVARDPEAQAVI